MKKSGAKAPPRRSKSADSTLTAAASTITTFAASPIHRRSLSAIPFSWEQHPGIAKPTIETKTRVSNNISPRSVLPLPPPMSLSNISIRTPKKSNATSVMIIDPFELALAECAKAPPTPPGLMEEIWGRKMVEPQRTRWWFGLRVHGGCNAASACSTVDSKVYVPRAGVHTTSCRILNHGGRFM